MPPGAARSDRLSAAGVEWDPGAVDAARRPIRGLIGCNPGHGAGCGELRIDANRETRWGCRWPTAGAAVESAATGPMICGRDVYLPSCAGGSAACTLPCGYLHARCPCDGSASLGPAGAVRHACNVNGRQNHARPGRGKCLTLDHGHGSSMVRRAPVRHGRCPPVRPCAAPGPPPLVARPESIDRTAGRSAVRAHA